MQLGSDIGECQLRSMFDASRRPQSPDAKGINPCDVAVVLEIMFSDLVAPAPPRAIEPPVADFPLGQRLLRDASCCMDGAFSQFGVAAAMPLFWEGEEEAGSHPTAVGQYC